MQVNRIDVMSREEEEDIRRRIAEHQALLLAKAKLDDERLGIEANLILRAKIEELKAMQAAEGSNQTLAARKLELKNQKDTLASRVAELRIKQAAEGPTQALAARELELKNETAALAAKIKQLTEGSSPALTAREVELKTEITALSPKVKEFRAMQVTFASKTMTEQERTTYSALRNALLATKMKPEAKKFETEAMKLQLEVSSVLAGLREDTVEGAKDLVVRELYKDPTSGKVYFRPNLGVISRSLQGRIEELKTIQAAIANGTITEEQWGRYHELRERLLTAEVKTQESEDGHQELLKKREALVAKIEAAKANQAASGTSKVLGSAK